MDDMDAIESLIDSRISVLRAELEYERQKRLLRATQVGVVVTSFPLWIPVLLVIVAVR